uniref:Reverse transcriptase n=1 Tax=Tanacetum cinerariifolium TaxID=118510 RepID=A0A6L2JQ24_TANCI|nr:reverse transcriptase [Tanacetum cinerariifolium]
MWKIKQERYALKILKEAGMKDCNATLCLMELGLKLSKVEDEPEAEATQYRKGVGCLRYLLYTRPDLTYSVGVVSRYMQSPKEPHAHAIKQILYYLKGTNSFGIKYKRCNDMKLVGYNDSSHNVDIDDGRSTTGHIFYLGGNTFTLAITSFVSVENEQVLVEHVSGENQRVDPLMKAWARLRFKDMRSLLGVQELPSLTQKF